MVPAQNVYYQHRIDPLNRSRMGFLDRVNGQMLSSECLMLLSSFGHLQSENMILMTLTCGLKLS